MAWPQQGIPWPQEEEQGRAIGMIRGALRKADYIEEQFYNDVRDKLSQYDRDAGGRYLPSTLILTGASGVGKTEAALQLIKDLKKANRQSDFLEWQFCCDSIQALLNDMTSINAEHHLQMASLENIQRRGNLDTVFEELFKVLDEKFPNHYKCLKFDDAELSTHVVRRINDWICEKVEEKNYRKWKMIVTTTDDDEAGWLHGCECIREGNFTKIEKFQIGETQRFMARVPDLQEEQIAQLHNKLDGLPVALKVAREYLMSNMLGNNVSGYLERFFNDLDRIDPQNRVNACFYLCIERLVDSLQHPELARSLMKMISLLDEKNITADVLTALAEVVIVGANGHVNMQTRATVLSSKLLEGLKNRFLCEVMAAPTGNKVVSLHKLVKQSAILFRQDDSPDQQRVVVRMCLMALTRILPKDGRTHQSHIIYSYIYRHACSLAGSIRTLKDKGVIGRRDCSEIMLLYSSLLSSMAYCLLAQRIPLEEATPLLNEALDVYSDIFTERTYDSLSANGNLDDVEKAQILLSEGRGEGVHGPSPLMDNGDYADIVSNLSPYFRLTLKDLINMISFEEVRDERHYLEDGHINQYYLNELISRNMIVGAPTQERIYYIEILIEIYYVWVRIHSFSERETLNRAHRCGRAALFLCEHVRNTYNTPLMAEVIIQRSVLEIELKMGDQNVNRILQDYTALAEVGNDDSRRYGYEYGVRRTDFYQDDYHRLFCKEGRAACFGNLCEQSRQQNPQDAENYFMQGDEIFQTLTAENQRNPNFQTLSKSFKRYAEFLAQCGKNDEAVRILLDAMYFLHKHLKQRASDGTDHPEQNKCGKFTDLYVKLEKFYGAWTTANPNRNTMLLRDGTDARRNEYLYSFNDYYRHNHPQAQAGGSEKYSIMIDLLPRNYRDIDDGDYHPIVATEGGDFRPVPPQNP